LHNYFSLQSENPLHQGQQQTVWWQWWQWLAVVAVVRELNTLCFDLEIHFERTDKLDKSPTPVSRPRETYWIHIWLHVTQYDNRNYKHQNVHF